MKARLIGKMQEDMGLTPYLGESNSQLTARIIYSALCQWGRAISCEIDEDGKPRSKTYFYKRIDELIESYIACFPEIIQWFCADKTELRQDFIHTLRNRMISSGEIIVDDENRLVCAAQQEQYLSDDYSRIVGNYILNKKTICVGVSRIIKKERALERLIFPSKSAEEYVDWLYEYVAWNKIKDITDYEMFDALSTNPPYQSWGDSFNKAQKYHLGRLTLYNGYKEYHLLKYENGSWSNSILNNFLVEQEEYRRLILGLRHKCGNSLVAWYEHRNSAVLLYLYCRLPYAEAVFMDTYCWPLKDYKDTCYVVPFKIWDVVVDKLQNQLCIVLKEK